ncbi:MAG: hypothetical protein CMM61_07615 [Rhodospirillaceae bacterium]|nr:hypothetical protein [Rhodospirillaceae bacterium]
MGPQQGAGNDDVLNLRRAIQKFAHFGRRQMTAESLSVAQARRAHGLHAGGDAAQRRAGREFLGMGAFGDSRFARIQGAGGVLGQAAARLQVRRNVCQFPLQALVRKDRAAEGHAFGAVGQRTLQAVRQHAATDRRDEHACHVDAGHGGLEAFADRNQEISFRHTTAVEVNVAKAGRVAADHRVRLAPGQARKIALD